MNIIERDVIKMDDLRQRKKNLLYFPLGTVGRDMMYALVTNYLYSFVLFTHELTAAQLSAIAAIMVAARIFVQMVARLSLKSLPSVSLRKGRTLSAIAT